MEESNQNKEKKIEKLQTILTALKAKEKPQLISCTFRIQKKYKLLLDELKKISIRYSLAEIVEAGILSLSKISSQSKVKFNNILRDTQDE